MHPSGETLIAASSLQRLSVIDLRTGRVEHEMIPPFGEQAVRCDFDAPDSQAAFRREMQDVLRIFNALACRRSLFAQAVHATVGDGLR